MSAFHLPTAAWAWAYYISIEYFGAGGSGNATKWPPSVDFKDISSNEQEAVGRLTDFIVCFR